MNKGKKSAEVNYHLRQKLEKLEAKQQELQQRLETNPDMQTLKELNLVNYHLECTENRLNNKFVNEHADLEAEVMTNHLTYTGQR